MSEPFAPRAMALLGPQRLTPTLAEAVRTLGVPPESRIATVTAGWQEREPDDQELDQHLGGRTVNLQLYRRAERIAARDPELATAHRKRQDLLRDMQALYQLRLHHAMAACLALLRMPGSNQPLEAERDAAIEAVRGLDARHLDRVRLVHAEFENRWRPHQRAAVAAEHQGLGDLLGDCAAVAIAGGHVAVLLNRLRFFDCESLLGERAVLAWSAGAMALSERVVLFHDDPPQGAGHAEVLEAGLGWARGVVPLPHAHRRLRLDDPARIGLMARRFAPAVCVALEDGATLVRRGPRWQAEGGARQLGEDGGLAPPAAA